MTAILGGILGGGQKKPVAPVPVQQIDNTNRAAATDEAAERRRRIAAKNNQQGVATSSAGLAGSPAINRPTLKRTLGA